jgi:hypothetical protein
VIEGRRVVCLEQGLDCSPDCVDLVFGAPGPLLTGPCDDIGLDPPKRRADQEGVVHGRAHFDASLGGAVINPIDAFLHVTNLLVDF